MKTIFVSSTFKDMHFERDAIQEITLPILKHEASKYGESVSFCDLRWGINTGNLDSEEGARKVLDVCLDEIDRCKPPMVVILGDRYGWIPSETLTRTASERKKVELEDLQISVTALEIAYGALSTPERCGKTLFYFRHIESDAPSDYAAEDTEHEEKLAKLKARIERLTEGRIKHYTVRWNGERLDGVIPFAELLAKDIKEALLPEWKEKELLTPFERERLTHWSFIAEKNAMFSARDGLVQQYYDDLTQNGTHFLAIKAPSGSGKSMLLSNLALRLRDSGFDVLPFISGLTAESNDSTDILRSTVYYMEELLGLSHGISDPDTSDIALSGDASGEPQRKNEVERLRERLLGLSVECEQAGRHVVILVDAVDQLSADEHRDRLIFIPERLSGNVKFVMTALPDLPIDERPFVTLTPMGKEEKKAVIRGILRSHSRELEDKVIRRMIKTKASSNPLFLSLLVQRLLMMNREDFLAIKKAGDGMSAITEHQLSLIAICPDSLQKMSAALLSEAGKRINEVLVRKVAEYLAVSRRGLRREDLAALLGEDWNALDFAHFITYMDEDFIERDDGRFDFSHKCIREGFLELCTDVSGIHDEILTHLKSLPNNDTVKIEEIMYHCIQLDRHAFAVEYLCEAVSSAASGPAAKLLFMQSAEDGGEWVRTLISCAHAAKADAFFDFLLHDYFTLPYSEVNAARVQMLLSEEVCTLFEENKKRETLTDILRLVEVHSAAAEAYRLYRILSYYSEGENKSYWIHHEQIFQICEAEAERFQSDELTAAMARSAMILIHSPRGKRAKSREFQNSLNATGLSGISPLHAQKAISLSEALLEKTSAPQYRLDLIISYILMAGYSYFKEYDKTTNYNYEALCKNPYYLKADALLSELNPSDIARGDAERLSECYMYLATYFVSMHEDGKETGCFYLQKAIGIRKWLSDTEPTFDRRKSYLHSLAQGCKYCVAIQRNFRTGDALLSYGITLAEALYLKTYGADVLSIYITLQRYRNLIATNMGKNLSNVDDQMRIFGDLTVFFSSHYAGGKEIKRLSALIYRLWSLSKKALQQKTTGAAGMIAYFLSRIYRPFFRRSYREVRFLPCEMEYLSAAAVYFRDYEKAYRNSCAPVLALWSEELVRRMKESASLKPKK